MIQPIKNFFYNRVRPFVRKRHDLFQPIQDIQITEREGLGVQGQNGNVARLFGENLSGIEVNFSLPIITDACPVKLEVPSNEYEFLQCIRSNGVDSYAGLPFSFSSSTLTVSFWVYIDTTGNHNILGQSGENLTIMRLDTSLNVFRVRCNTGGIGNTTFAIPALSTDNWYHFFYADNGTNGRLWVDGVESSSGAVATGGTYNLDQVFTRDGNDFLDGLLDDLLLTNTYGDPATEAARIAAEEDPLEVIPTAQHLYRFNENANNSGSLGGSLTLNNFAADPYEEHL